MPFPDRCAGLFNGLITGIEIPDTVTDIGVRAFSGTGIIDITIPESVLRIGDHAFGNCPYHSLWPDRIIV